MNNTVLANLDEMDKCLKKKPQLTKTQARNNGKISTALYLCYVIKSLPFKGNNRTKSQNW